jgi:hypothetical protein
MTKAILMGALLTLAACQGQLLEAGGDGTGGPGDPGGPGSGPGGGGAPGGGPGDPGTNPDRIVPGDACKTLNPGASPVRRLSNAEYKNVLVDLIGDSALAEQVTNRRPNRSASATAPGFCRSPT